MKTKKLLALLLSLVLVIGLLPMTALAGSNDITIIVDLTGYNGAISGSWSGFSNATDVDLKAGQTNEFILYENTAAAVLNFTLTELSAADVTWSVTGSITNNDGLDNYLYYQDNVLTGINLYPIGWGCDGELAISVVGNSFSLLANDIEELFCGDCFGGGTTLRFTPVTGKKLVSAESNDSEMGSTKVTTTGESNQYVLTATANKNYAFSYWLEKNAENISANRITSNPYTITTDTETAYVAYFRELYTVTADSEDTDKGTVSAQYTETENGADKYKLTATPANYYMFEKWTCGDEESADNPLEVSVTESGKTYTAHFKPVTLTLGDGAELRNASSVTDGFTSVKSSISGIPSVGSRTTLYIPMDIPEGLENVTIALSVQDEQGQELAAWSETGTFYAYNGGYFCATLDPTPAFESLTVTLTLTTPAGITSSTKTYDGLAPAASEENDDFRYLTHPHNGYDTNAGPTVQDAGPCVSGVYAIMDEETNALSLYFKGTRGGYYQLIPGGETDLAAVAAADLPFDPGEVAWTYGLRVYNAAAAGAPATASVGNSIRGIGQDQNGDWYLFVNGKSYDFGSSGGVEGGGAISYSYTGSDVYKWNESSGRWVYQIMSEFNDPEDGLPETVRRIRPDGVDSICSPAPGVSVMYGIYGNGSLYLSTDNVTVTFDPGEGRILGDATLTAPILSEIDVIDVPGALLAGRDFGGWFYDADYTIAFDTNGVMPGADVTVYAKWTEKEGLTDELAFYRERALASLEQRYKQYSSANYSAANWTRLQAAYEDGKTAINSAAVGTDRVDENINAALTAATEAMAAIPKQAPQKQYITVAVSMDANTLGLGYLIEPTLVTVEEGTQASVVITDLIKQMAAEKYGVTSEGYTTYHESEPAAAYPWMMTGSVTSDFYLAQVYYPEQENYKLPDFLETAVGGTAFDDSDKNGNYLGEFDYTYTSGWTYSIGDRYSGNAQFPGIGASGWNLSDGEVMRWQFTLVGYGSDLNADNTQWGSQSIVPTLGDKSALTWKVAEINKVGTKASYGEDYDKAIAVLTDAEATQKAVNDALAALKTHEGGAAGGSSNKDKKTETEADGAVTAEELQAAADKGKGIDVVTENGTVKLDAGTVKELAKGGEDVEVELTKNADGTTTVGVTADGKAVEADVKIELPAKDGQMLVVVGPDGKETPVILSATEDGTMYAKVSAGSTVKVVDAEGKDFGDVKAGDWFAEAVEFVSSHGIFQGTGDGTFAPGTTMNRAMLAMVLYRIDGAAGGGQATFGDVDPGAWYADAVSWAADAGIVNGRGEGFAPDAPVTREEIATMLYRFVKHLGVDVSGASADLAKFPDGGDTSPWAGEAMQWAVSVGLFRGGSGGALNPGGEATRAEVATLVERLVTLLVK